MKIRNNKVPIDKMPQLLIAINHKTKYAVENMVDIELNISKKQYKEMMKHYGWAVFPLEEIKRQIWDYVVENYPDCKFANLMYIRKYGDKHYAMVDILS